MGPALARLFVVAGLIAACGSASSTQPAVLLDAAGTGNATATLVSPSRSGWDLKWSYDCSNTGGNGVFVVDVYDADRTPDFKYPGVNEAGDKDAGLYHVPGSGRFYIEITTTCRWMLKVLQSQG